MPTCPRVGKPYVESLMQLRWPVRFVLPVLCFAACQAPRSPGFVRAPVVDEALWSEFRALREIVSQQLVQAMPRTVPAWQPAGLQECNARMGTLTDRLQDLAQVLSYPAGKGMVEAAAERSRDATSDHV